MRCVCYSLLGVLLGCGGTPVAPAQPEARSPSVREDKWQIRDTRLLVRDVGPESAPTIVVIHGGPGGNHLSLRPLEALAPRFRVVFYDQRGTGESDRFRISSEMPALDQLAMEENVEDLEALRQRLGKDRITLIGHSWGGSLAVFYAAAYPAHVEKLIVYSGGPEDLELSSQKRKAHLAKLNPEEQALAKTRIAELQKAAEQGSSQDVIDRLFLQVSEVMFASLYCQRPAKATAAQGRAGFWASQGVNQYIATFDRAAFASKLAAVKSPTLLTWGRCEPSPQERLTYLLDSLPNAQLVIFETSGHNAMEEEPSLFLATLKAFLDGKTLPTRSFRTRAELGTPSASASRRAAP
ncbi:MAG: prolyl aminopeptidase [Deltaproteobacteria bacterium]|nr:prolyl aminopeptidase [Deltaproteobacteria bacterium]